MSKASASPAAHPTSTPVKEPAKTSPARLGILLGLLAIAIVMLAHHKFSAAPATEQAYKDIDKLFSERNSKGVTGGGDAGKIDALLLTPKDIQELIKKTPFSRDVKPEYTIENFWWYGLPDRNYVSVLYYGSGENLRFHTHYLNAPPPAEDLPGAESKGGPEVKPNLAPAEGAEGGAAPAPLAPEGEAAPAAPAGEAPAADKPAEAAPEAKSAEAKPAEEKKAE